MGFKASKKSRGVVAAARRRAAAGFTGLEALESRVLLSADLSLTPTGSNFTTLQQNGQTVVQVAAGSTIHFTAAISQTDDNNIEAFQLDFSNSDVGAGKLTLSNWATNGIWSPPISAFIITLSDTDISDNKVEGSTSGSGHGVSTLGTFDVTVPNQAGQWLLTPDVPGKLSGITLSGTALVSDIVISFSPSAKFVNVADFGDVLLRVLPNTLPTVSVSNATVAEGNNPALATVSLSGTVRDFIGSGTTSPNKNGAASNPDFESSAGLNYRVANPGVAVTGAVSSTLGNNGLPVFVGGTTFTNSTNFNQWYTDTPGINESQPLTLNLTSDGQDYVFTGVGADSGKFYPIDNQLFGNTVGANIFGDPVAPDHNWNFTYDTHSTFVYEPGQNITITADDDAWLFINNQLVSDRGGVNIGITNTVNLDTLGLTAGQQYNFDLFYAERHTTDAILQLQTNIPLGVSLANQPTFADVSVSLSAASPVSTLVNFSTANGTAIAGTDYVATSGTLVFAPGETSKTIRVPIIGNTTAQSNRSFNVVLSSPTDATIATDTGATTIDDDDAAPPTPLTETINQAVGQIDPTGTSPINYTVVFSAPVTDFATGDVTLGGTAGATTAVVTGSGTTYNVAVSDMTQSGTVIASLAAGVAHDGNNTANNASTGSDNSVTYNKPAPVLGATAEITAQQLDATHYRYTLALHNTGGTTIGTFWYAWLPNEDFLPVQPTNIVSPAGWTGQAFPGASSGYSIQWTATNANADLAAGNSLTTFQFDSTATPAQIEGNSSAFPGTPINTSAAYTGTPLVGTEFDFVVTSSFGGLDTTAPTVTINQAAGQIDPTTASSISYTVVFSEPVTDFATGDVSFTGSTAGGTLVGTVGASSDGGMTYNVSVTGMTSSGTVVATIAAGAAHDAADNPSAASTSTDHTVTYSATQALPTVSIIASDPNASESTLDTGTFTVQIDHAISTNLTVLYDTSFSTAVPGTDYIALSPHSVVIPAGQTSATITITPIDAGAVSGSKTVELNIANPFHPNYAVNGGESDAVVTIADDDTQPVPHLNLTINPPVVPQTLVPGDLVTITGKLNNTGTAAAAGPITVKAYLLPAGQDLPTDTDQAITTATIQGGVAANKSASWTAKVPVPGTLPVGSYHVVIVATGPDGTLSGALPPITLALSLGAIDGHKAVTKLTVDGIGYAYSGPGTVQIVPGQGGQPDAVQVVGTTSKSSLTITAPKGTSKTFGDITITGSAKALNLANITLAGDVTIDGTVATLKLGNVSGGQSIDITGVDLTGKLSLALTAGTVSDLSINSSIPIKSIAVTGWDNTDATPDTITAPSIGSITSKGDFEANVTVSNAAAKASLGSVSAKGILESIIRSAGTISSVTAGRIVNSLILVATVNPNLNGLPDVGSSPFVVGSPIPPSIGKVTATGIKNNPNPSFVNSDIVAPTVGTVSLKDVATVNDGSVKFGVAAHLLKSLSRTAKPAVKNLSALGDNDADGDFVLRIV